MKSRRICAVAALLMSGYVAMPVSAAELLPPVSPALSSAARVFCADAVRTVGTFGFHDYKLRHEDMRPLFTGDGWDRQNAALDHSRTLDTMTAYHLIQTTAVDNAGCNVVSADVERGSTVLTVRTGALRTVLAPNNKSEMPIGISMRLVQSGDALLIDNWIEGPS